MVDRIRQLLQARELSPTQFADTIGVARPIVSHILGGRNKPSLEVVQKIIAAFPDVALPWLLSGQGNMLASTAPAAATKAAAETTGPAPSRASRRPSRVADEPEKASQTAPSSTTTAPPASPVPPVTAGDLTPPAATAELNAAPATRPDAAIGPLVTASAKSIRRVLIFYSDGTFADFSPSPDGF